MSIGLNYQLSIFGDYNIEPTPQKMTEIMNTVNETGDMIFLPSLITGQRIDSPNGLVQTTSNLGWVTQDQMYNIAILDDRIDINYNKQNNNLTDSDIDEFYKMASKLMVALMSNLDVKARRLAVNLQMLIDTLTEDAILKLSEKMIACPIFAKEKPKLEWSYRLNVMGDISIQGKQEELNIITDINTARAIADQKLVLLYHIDINTFPKKTDLRFTKDAIAEFVGGTLPMAKQVLTDVEGMVVCE